MANGIESRYTGIPIVPEVIEEKTRPWDAIESLYGMVKQEEARTDKKKLDWGKLNAQIEANQDLKDYRSESIDLQNREADNLKAYRRKQGEIAGQNANTAAATQKSNAQFQKDTTFINRIKLLPEGERLREILLYGAENPGYMKRSGTSTEKINERIKDLEDYKMDMTRASGFYKSNNPLQIKYHMKKLIDGDISTNEAARDIYAALGTQLGTAEKFQKELYEATPKEIAEMYPEYAENLKSIAQKFMPQLDLAKMSGDEAFKAMSAQKKAIPVGQMEAYNAQVRIITDSYANKYRMAKGIGVYDTATQFPTETEAQAEFEIAPDDYTLTDERYKLIEKAQDENNPLWEKWLNEEDYTFEDLKTDYEAGLKEADTGGVEEQEQQVQEQQVQEQVSEGEDVDIKTTSFSILPLDQPPATTPTFKGKKINLPMWEELMDKRLHPVTKAPLPKYDWMDDYAKMLTGDPNAVASDLLTKKGRSHWRKIK